MVHLDNNKNNALWSFGQWRGLYGIWILNVIIVGCFVKNLFSVQRTEMTNAIEHTLVGSLNGPL